MVINKKVIQIATFAVTILFSVLMYTNQVSATRCFREDYPQTPEGNQQYLKCIEDERKNNNPPTEDAGAVGGTGSTELDELLNTIINVLSVVAGLSFVVSFIIAGVQYTTARDNASQVSAAKNRILMTILAFALFLMGYALLQWLIPGGIW